MPEQEITITDLYPELSAEEQESAEYNLSEYARIIKQIIERTSREESSGQEVSQDVENDEPMTV